MLVAYTEAACRFVDLPDHFCWMLIWRLRNSKELMTILEELDALVDRKLLNDMYRMATSEKTLVLVC